MRYMTKFSSAALIAMTACAPLQTFYKEGETVARLDRTLTTCKVNALAQVPTDIRRRYVPPTYAPYRICRGHGHCYWHHRILSPGRYEEYDANLSLRRTVTGQCMADKGFMRASIPPCDAEVTRNTDLKATQVMPPLTAKSCAIRLKSGRYQIVTPGVE